MIEAVVQTGSFETPYRRAGSGGAVLLLLGGSDAGFGDDVFRALAGAFRVIAPAMPPGVAGAEGARLEAWLRGLIDGLGLNRPALVAAASYGPALLRFAEVDPDRIDRLALLGPGAPTWPDPALADAVDAALHPVLLVDLQGSDGLAISPGELARLLAFLTPAPVAPAQATTGTRRLS